MLMTILLSVLGTLGVVGVLLTALYYYLAYRWWTES